MNQKKTTVSSQVEDNRTSILLLKQDIGYVKSALDEIKNDIKDIKEELPNAFATKSELVNLDKRLKDVEDLKNWFVRIVLGAIIVSILALMGLNT